MPTPPQPPARPAPPQPPQARPANVPPAQPVNRPQGATAGPAQTYPPGSRYARDIPNEGPDPQEAKLRPWELAATRPQEEEAVLTVAQEQRERSEEIQAEGVERYKARHDERDPRDRPRTVPGVSPTQVEP
jgi:hypothetical protein